MLDAEAKEPILDPLRHPRTSLRRGSVRKLRQLLNQKPTVAPRLERLRRFARNVRSSEYHITHACNIRCQGCWFFEYGFDRVSNDERDLEAWRDFIRREQRRGITAPLLIGGEPTLFLDRMAVFVDAMPYTSVSTNGLVPIPRKEFSNLAIAITLFGGGSLDDELRGIRPSGAKFSGLLSRALHNYHNDERAHFIHALSSSSLPYLDETVMRIRDNGNRLTFNYYSTYGSSDPLRSTESSGRLLEAALRVKDRYPETVSCHPYFIRAILTGRSHFGEFGYAVCPSLSVDHPDHKERLRNGNPFLPLFNSYASDTRTINFCCTSGHCDACRDSQAVYSWLLGSLPHFLDSLTQLELWLDIAESYWSQFIWSPYHPQYSV